MKPISLRLITTISLSLLLWGCSGGNHTENSAQQSYPEGTYCINGGNSNNYSCNSTPASHALPIHPRTVDEEWMYDKLHEIRDWLNEEKYRRSQVDNTSQTQTAP
ncbi:MAG: hypothetical protein ACRBB6_15390 [Neptuniibacter sp.]